MVDRLEWYLPEHIDHVDWNASVQMNDKLVVEVSNIDLSNLIRISNDHEDHCNHLKMYRDVSRKNNLLVFIKCKQEFIASVFFYLQLDWV